MYKDYGSYFMIEEFKEKGIGAVFTNKKYGDVKEMFLTSENREENIEGFMKKFSLEGKTLICSKQTHSKNIVNIKERTPIYFDDVDGFVTDRRDMVLFTIHADCLPIYFYDTKKNVIGLCHSGWKGSFFQIGKEVLKNMEENYGSMKRDILVGIGVGAGRCCYQVGADFYENFRDKFSEEIIEASFEKRKDDWYFDNREFNYMLLIKNGIYEKNIVKSEKCTVCDDIFHSYRRQGKDAGRNGAFIYFED
jgi:YfiH family protein